MTVNVKGALTTGSYAILNGLTEVPSPCWVMSDVTEASNYVQQWSLTEEGVLSVTLTVLPETEGKTVTQELSENATLSADTNTGDALTLTVKDGVTLTVGKTVALRSLSVKNGGSEETPGVLTFAAANNASLSSKTTTSEVDTDARAGVHGLGDVTLANGKTLTLGDTFLSSISGTGRLVLDGPSRQSDTMAQSIADFVTSQESNALTLKNGASLSKANDTMLTANVDGKGSVTVVGEGTSTLAFHGNAPKTLTVQDNAEANLKLRDFAGYWSFQGASRKVIVENSTVNTMDVDAVGCFEGQLVLRGTRATVNRSDSANHTFNFWHGGSDETPNLLVEPGTEATFNGALHAQNGTAVVGVGKGATLTLSGVVRNRPLRKVGEGTLVLSGNGDSNETNEIVIRQGDAEVQTTSGWWWGHKGPGNNRTLRVEKGAVLNLRKQDATGYDNNASSVIALEGGEMQVHERDTNMSQLHLTGGTVRLMAGAENDGRGYDFYRWDGNVVNVFAAEGATESHPTVSWFTYQKGEPEATQADRKMTIRRGVLQIDVERFARLDVENELSAQSKETDAVCALEKSGAGELRLLAQPTYTGATTISGGTLTLGEGITLPTSSDGTLQGDLRLANGGVLNGSASIASGKVFGGEGTVTGDVTLADGAILEATPALPTVLGEVKAQGTVTLRINLTNQACHGTKIVLPGKMTWDQIGDKEITLNGEATTDWELKEEGEEHVLVTSNHWQATLSAEQTAIDGTLTLTATEESSQTKTLADVTTNDTVTLTLAADTTLTLEKDITPAQLNVEGDGVLTVSGESAVRLLSAPFLKAGSGTLKLCAVNTIADYGTSPITVREGTLMPTSTVWNDNGKDIGNNRTIRMEAGTTFLLGRDVEHPLGESNTGGVLELIGSTMVVERKASCALDFVMQGGTISLMKDAQNSSRSLDLIGAGGDITVLAAPGATAENPTVSRVAPHEPVSSDKDRTIYFRTTIRANVEKNAQLDWQALISTDRSCTFEKLGAGELRLSAAVMDSRISTTVSEGTLTLTETGSLAGTLAVSSGATLRGAGEVKGTLTFADGAVLDATQGAMTASGAETYQGALAIVLPEPPTETGIVVLKGVESAPEAYTLTLASGDAIDASAMLTVKDGNLCAVLPTLTAAEGVEMAGLSSETTAMLRQAAKVAGLASVKVRLAHADGSSYGADKGSLEAVSLFNVEPKVKDDGTLTVAYDFGITWMTVRDEQEQTVALVEAQVVGGTIAEGASVTLTDAEGKPIANAVRVTDRSGTTEGVGDSSTMRWFRVPLDWEVEHPKAFRVKVSRP